METHVSILGVCVSRDVFGTHRNDGGFVVDAYMQNCNPISAVSPSPLRQFLDDDFWTLPEGASSFAKRLLDLDLNKGVFPYFAKRKSEWLLLDFASVWAPVFETGEGVGTVFQPFAHLLPLLRERGYIGDYRTYYAAELPLESLYPLIDRYLERVLGLYPQERIICMDVRAASDYLLPGKTRLAAFARREVENVNPLAGELYRYAVSRLPRSHRVPFPEGVVGDALHKWGCHMLHFTQDYYDYALNAIRIITGQKYALPEENRAIQALRAACEARLAAFRQLPRADSPAEPVVADVLSAEADPPQAFVGREVALTVKTSPAAQVLSLFAENIRQASAWQREGNSTLEDGARVWRLRYAFRNPGERTLRFAAFANAWYGGSATLPLFVDDAQPFVLRLQAEAAELPAGKRLRVTLTTSASAERLALFAETGRLIRTWDAERFSRPEARYRAWEVDFPIVNPGRRLLTFRCGRGEAYGLPSTLRVNVIRAADR